MAKELSCPCTMAEFEAAMKELDEERRHKRNKDLKSMIQTDIATTTIKIDFGVKPDEEHHCNGTCDGDCGDNCKCKNDKREDE